MAIACTVVLTFFLASIINSAYKRYKYIQLVKNSIIRFRAVRRYFDNENKEIRERNKHDLELESGNDFSYDKHGNVVYGENYIGAPRLPNNSRGLTYGNFKRMYFSFDEKIRVKVIENIRDNLDVNSCLFRLVDILCEYEHKESYSFEKNVFLYLRETVGEQGQLSYFNEVIYFFYLERAQQRLKYLLCDFGKKFFE
jgi:hypothetical protein